MARWVPDEHNVASTERVGRRLFDEPALVGAADQRRPKGSLDLRHFEENRGAGEVSVDRLGKTGKDKKVVTYLRPKAEADGRKFTKPRMFHGWVLVQAKELLNPKRGPSLSVVPSPVQPANPEHVDHNPYHAHVIRPHGHDSYTTALCLKYVFEQHGDYELCASGQRGILGFLHGWVMRIVLFIRRSLSEP